MNEIENVSNLVKSKVIHGMGTHQANPRHQYRKNRFRYVTHTHGTFAATNIQMIPVYKAFKLLRIPQQQTGVLNYDDDNYGSIGIVS